MDIIQQPLNNDNYCVTETKKDAIFIHHTAGGHRPDWTINSWNGDSLGRIATAYVIGGISTTNPNDTAYNGKIYRAFDSKFWGFHLGVKGTNGALDKKSIGFLTNSSFSF